MASQYIISVVDEARTWTASSLFAAEQGGQLASLSTRAENKLILDAINDSAAFFAAAGPSGQFVGPWIGLVQDPGSAEPGGGWKWLDGSKFNPFGWHPTQPDNFRDDNAGTFFSFQGTVGWADQFVDPAAIGYASSNSAVVEFTDDRKKLIGLEKSDYAIGAADINNFLTGNAGADTLDGGEAKNGLDFDGVNYRLELGRGSEALGTVNEKGAGNVYVNLSRGDIKIGSVDGLTVAAGTAVDTYGDIDVLKNIEAVGTGTGRDVIVGDNGSNIFFSGKGNDALVGNGEADRLSGEEGDDILVGGTGADTLDGGGGTDLVRYSDEGGKLAVNVFLGGETGDPKTGLGTDSFGFADKLVDIENVETGGGRDVVQGSDVANEIITSGGDDTLDGGKGVDTLIGGKGNDDYGVDDAADVVIEAKNEGSDTVFATVSYKLAEDSFVDLLIGEGQKAISLTGNDMRNAVVGNGSANLISGEGGDDIVSGGGAGNGRDTLAGGLGNDLYEILEGNEAIVEKIDEGFDGVAARTDHTLAAGQSIDAMIAVDDKAFETINSQLNAGKSLLEIAVNYDGGGKSALNLTGNDLNQFIVGSNGSNVIEGRGGSDVIFGFGGVDTFRFDKAFGKDQIVGFEAGKAKSDVIAIHHDVAVGQRIDTFAEVIAAATEKNGDTTIKFGSLGEIKLSDVTIAELDKNDLSFF